MSTTRRIGLPSGGWWEMETRPRWRHVRAWAEGTDARLVEEALASLTVSWSFPDEVCPQSVARRDPDDLAAALDVFVREVSPRLEPGDARQMAEELFAGLVSGRVPRRFAEVHLMAATGWTWQELQDTPADVVQAMSIYLGVTQARERQSTLDFHEGVQSDGER